METNCPGNIDARICKLLQKEVIPATGCTEPAAIALTVARAYALVPGKLKKVKVLLSSSVFKNAKAVGIPGTEYTGVDLAALLGIVLEKPVQDLTIFSSLQEEQIEMAVKMREEGIAEVAIKESCSGVFIQAQVETEKGHAQAITEGGHTRLVFLQQEQEVLLDLRGQDNSEKEHISVLSQYSLSQILQRILSMEASSWQFLQEGLRMNMAVARAGLELDKGLGVGRTWKKLVDKGLFSQDLSSKVALYTAAACDARMSGVQMPVMSSAGSGNHGLAAIIPVAITGQELKKDEGEINRALAISHLINIYIKHYTGRLSPICGCAVAACSGAGAGIAFLLGGGLGEIEEAVKNVISSLAGMVCDGGKVGCALKLSSSAVTAWWCGALAREGLKVPAGNGLIAHNVQDTIKNLGYLSSVGMDGVDNNIISLLTKPCD